MREIWQAWCLYCRDPKNKWDFYDHTRAILLLIAVPMLLYRLLVVLTAGY